MPKFLFILMIFLTFPVFGFDLPVSRIPDDSHLRARMKDTWLIDSSARALSMRPVIETLESGERVRISVTEGREEFMVLFSRELVRDAGSGAFPGWAQGSWIFTRRKDTGAGINIRIFLRSDQNTYIQFKPFDAEKSQMEVILYGGIIARFVIVPVPFERLYTMQLNEILRLVENKFPVRYFEPEIGVYRDNRAFVANVRRHIGPLRFADDGAVDENGNYVFIETLRSQNPQRAGLNCSGFAKWLIDGLLRPVTGNRLSIEPLKAPHGQRGSSFTEYWEESRDIFFGLDWIRNLAAAANSALRSPAYGVLDEFEVRANYFNSVLIHQNNSYVIESYPGFMREAGFGVEGLYPLLYTLAIDEPYSFYLAAVSNEIANPSSPRGTPRLRQYYHVAALVPYFDENGIFRIVVFESAAETSFTAFRNRYPGHFVSLVRIPITSGFEP